MTDSSPTESRERDTTDATPGQATPAAAALILEFGRIAFDTERRTSEELLERCEAWIAHLLHGERSPRSRKGGRWRDWPGLREFFVEERSEERDYVEASSGKLRELVWTIVHELVGGFQEDEGWGRAIERELDRLRDATRRLNGVTLDQEVSSVVGAITRLVEERRVAQASRVEELGEALEAAREEIREARREASIDPLTRVFNRRTFDARVERSADLSVLVDRPAVLLLVDIDHFKAVNDQYGHLTGDAVLREVADQLCRSFPRKTDFVARYGGEEFAVVLDGESARTGEKMADRFRKALRKRVIEHDAGQVRVTASIGVAELEPARPPEEWVAHADRALYRAKALGRDRVVVFGSDDA